MPLATLVQGRTGLPVAMENDVSALVEADLTSGAGMGYGLVLGGRRVPFTEDGRGFGRHLIIDPHSPPTPPETAAVLCRCSPSSGIESIANFALPQKILDLWAGARRVRARCELPPCP